MSDAWTHYSGAPAPGARLCALANVPEEGTLCLDLGGFSVLIVRARGSLAAFVNACPHQYLPLDFRGDRLLSADGTVVRCTNHEAGFDAETGEGVEGLGIGCELDAIPVVVNGDGDIVIAP